MDFEKSFIGKTAISTGAASGLGLLFAENFCSLFGNVVLCDVNAEALTKAVDEINAKGKGKAVGVVCDVRNYSEVVAVINRAESEFGRIDVVANFAGGYGRRLMQVEGALEFPDVPIDVFDFGIDLNLKGPFYCAHAALPVMRKQKSGVIINIGSITGAEGDAKGMDYPTAKAGVMYGLTKSIAQYGSKYGIRCVCVSPGPVLTRAAMASMQTLVGRAAEPQEIIDLCLFIASEKGQFINGENIMIDGGRNAMQRGG